MFKLIYGEDLCEFPALANQMFQDRRMQFHEDLGWELNVDDLGREIDRYDLMNPLYVILRDNGGRHLGSGRLLPTTGPTMIADHFSGMTDGVEIESPLIWEVTRVFIARRGEGSVRNAAALMWAGCEIARRSGVEFLVGVTATRMVRVFTACGWKPEVIGERAAGTASAISACLWEVSQENCGRLAGRAGIDENETNLSVYRRPVPARAMTIAGRAAAPAAASGLEIKMYCAA